MADGTKIAWSDATWNPLRGCTRVSAGCQHCYAERVAARFCGEGQPYHGLAKMVTRPDGSREARWTGKVELVEHMLDQPLRWRRPRRIFVNSMSDLFHESVADEWIDRVFAVMALAPHHEFQLLTKRTALMQAYTTDPGTPARVWAAAQAAADDYQARYLWALASQGGAWGGARPWPLRNVWLGTSIENQATADERLPLLRQVPNALPWVSLEPLLEEVDLSQSFDFLRWVTIGGESGPKARPCWVPNIRKAVRQLQAAGIAALVKQLGANVQDRNDAGFDGCVDDGWPDMDPDRIEHDPGPSRDNYQGAPVRVHLNHSKGGDMIEWPEDLRVREYPEP